MLSVFNPNQKHKEHWFVNRLCAPHPLKIRHPDFQKSAEKASQIRKNRYTSANPVNKMAQEPWMPSWSCGRLVHFRLWWRLGMHGGYGLVLELMCWIRCQLFLHNRDNTFLELASVRKLAE